MESTRFSEVARTISHRVLAEIAPPEEVEISLTFLDPLIEMAEQGEVQPTDVSDNTGGFGPADILAVSVAPLVVQVLRALEGERGDSDVPTRAAVEATIHATRPARQRLLARIGSPRANSLRGARRHSGLCDCRSFRAERLDLPGHQRSRCPGTA